MRLKMLCEDRCEDIAVNLAAACVRCLRRNDRLRSLSESHHVHYMIDVYIVLLYKLKRTQDIFAQLKLMDLNDGLELVQRLSGEKPTKYGTARVWRNSIKAAELVAQYLVTAGMVRPISETGANILEQILNSWALLHAKLKDVAPTLPGMIRKLIEPAESAQHIYIFCAVLEKHFGESIKPLVIELYIRALTTDMNELESQKAKSDKDKERETAKRLSTQFLKLANVVDSNIGIAKECVLTAFSLHPTRACYDRIKELAVACGKAKDDGVLQEGENIKKDDKIEEKNPGEDDLSTSTILVKSEIKVESEIMDNNSITETQSSSLIDSETQSLYQNSTIVKSINFQNEQEIETFEQNDQLLKSLLTAKKPDKTMSDTTMPAALTNNRCPLHPKHESLSGKPLGELCFNCGEFTGSNKLSGNKSQASEVSTMPSNNSLERTLDTLILIKGDTMAGSTNYDEKSVPSQVLDGEKLGLSPQLCDDLAVVLNSPRFNLLSWVLDWKELKNSCEQYLENAEEMRNTNKELKYLNIDYSQFKDWPSEDDTKDNYFGIEKGYEHWVDLPSDSSEQFGSFQPAAGYKRSSTRRSLDDTTTDSDSGSILRVRRTARKRKIHRLESSESDYDSTEPKPKRFRGRISSVSDSDSNTQDSQTDSLGSDGCRLEIKKKSNKLSNKESSKKRPKTSKLTVESVSHFHMLVNEDARRTNAHEDASGSDVSSNDIITLFSADMDENKRETIKGSAYTAAAQLIITTTERRSDPAVLKSLRMYRPQNSKKKPSKISQILQKNLLNKSKDTNNGNRMDCTEQQGTNNIAKFAPMLSTLNLNPKIVLTRTDEVDRKLTNHSKKQQQRLSSGDITSELINIKTTMPFSPNNKSVMTYQKKQKEHTVSGKNNNSSGKNDLDCSVVIDGHRDHHHHNRLSSVKSNLSKTKYDILAKAVRDSDILTKNVPGMNSLDMMVPPRQRSTVNVVQLSRNSIPQSPSSATGTAATINVSGNTPPRPTRTPSVASNQSSSGGNNSIQLPGTPSSTSGHDSGVGMSPAGQTPPLRLSSNLGSSPDAVGEEANQLPDAASPTISPTISATTMAANNPSSIHQLDAAAAAVVIESSGAMRTMAQIRRASNQHNNQSPRKSPSSPCSTGAIGIITTTTTTTTTSPGGLAATPITSESLKVICKPDGSYHIASLSPTQRNLLGLQNLDDGISFARQTTQQQQRVTDATSGASSNRNAYDRLTASSVKNTSQSSQNAVLPKFNQAFRKTLYSMSTDTPASSAANASNDTSLGNIQQTAAASTQKTTNLSKAVQTSVPNNQQQPQHQQQQQQQQTNAGNINVQSIIPNLQLSTNRQVVSIVPSSSNNGPTNTAINSNQIANQTITQLVQNASSPNTGVIYTHKVITNNPNQLNIIPTNIISHTNSGRTAVVKLNIRPVSRQQMTGAIQAVLQTPRLQQQQQQQQQQAVRTDSLIGSPIEVNNEVSSTTLEQLREFESVLEQVKERSIQPQAHHSISNNATTTTVQTQTTTQQTQANKQQQQQQQISVSALAQQLMMPTQPSANNESFASNGNTVTFQQESVFSQKVSVAYVNPSSGNQVVTAKVAANSTPTPVVVVTSYCQPAASPALSVTSQSSSSPCVTPAPTPSAGKTPPTPPSVAAAAAAAAAKTGVKKSTPKAVKTSATNTSKASPIPKPQQKPQEDEQTAQRIYAILDEYAEQLRNSPDLNNKPAPRRRSNPPTNPSQSSKRKKSSSSKTKPVGQQTSELSPSTDDLGRTMGSEDSSSGVVHVQDSPAGFSAPEEPSVNVNASSHAETSAEVRSLTSDSNDGVELNVKRRNLIFTEPGSNQPRAVIVQEALPSNSVSVSEALASVTSKMGGASVLMPGIVLPLAVAKGTQYIVGNTKILTVPTVRASNNSTNTLVLQSFLNQGKLITQPHVKQMKMQPTLQTLSNNNQTLTGAQNVQSASVVIPQTGSAQFVGETATATITTPDVKPNVIGDLTLKNEAAVTVSSGLTVESAATNAAIVVNKSNNPTISLIGTRTINEISDNQQICGVITSNPTLQSTTRLFNSSIHKLSTPATLKADNVVCIAPAAAAVSHSPDKKSSQDGREIHAEKPMSIQTGTTIALTFASQTDVNAILNDASQQQQKDTKEMSTEITAGTKIISPKKRKFNDVISIQENMSPRTLIPMNIATSLQNNTKIESSIISTNKQSSVIDSTTQFLVTGGPSSSDSQESSMQQSTETIDGSCKVGNGMLYENARLQEAWESEGKISPDTPWRYNPTSMNTLSNDSLKGYSRDSDNSEGVLQIINKGQGIEMASGQIYQSNTKKYFMNHTLDTSYSNKSNLMKSQLIPRMDRDLMQQRLERKAAAYERELKLQKSLSEECEDLGVDEPSTSDLFPEADLLFDTNHSPSFDHSSQDASCSQSLGMKPYNSSYFRSLDSSSGSRDASPTSDFKSSVNECKRNTSQRARTLKDSLKRGKREKEDLHLETPAKHMRLTMDNLSQDEASNSNSDISRLSPANLGSLENDSSKDMSGHHRVKLLSRSGSKEGTPSSVSSIPSNMKLDIDLDSESLPPSINVNNTSAASSGDESLTLLSGNTADHHTIPSPLSPLAAAGPLLSTHKYTYTNKKRIPSSKMRMDSYMAWESPMSERTRSSSEDEDSSISESISSQPEDNVALSNGLEDSVQTLKSLSTDRRCTYVKKKDKLQVNARVVLNRTDHKATATMAALPKRIPKTESIAITESMVVSSDKASEASEDEAGNIVLMEPADCRARRSSLRGHVKKGCACCNGSPERPKKKTTTTVKSDHKLKKRLSSKQPGKRR
ncbi:hypothetical protein ACFW04_002032 [Cataglyphis niger]